MSSNHIDMRVFRLNIGPINAQLPCTIRELGKDSKLNNQTSAVRIATWNIWLSRSQVDT